MSLYMTEYTYNDHLRRAERLAELEAPELILTNEAHMIDEALLVQTDEDGWHHFPAGEEGAAPLDAACSRNLLLLDEIHLDPEQLTQLLAWEKHLPAGCGLVLLDAGGFCLLPPALQGEALNPVLDRLADALDRETNHPSDPVLLPCAGGLTLVSLGPVQYLLPLPRSAQGAPLLTEERLAQLRTDVLFSTMLLVALPKHWSLPAPDPDTCPYDENGETQELFCSPDRCGLFCFDEDEDGESAEDYSRRLREECDDEDEDEDGSRR